MRCGIGKLPGGPPEASGWLETSAAVGTLGASDAIAFDAVTTGTKWKASVVTPSGAECVGQLWDATAPGEAGAAG